MKSINEKRKVLLFVVLILSFGFSLKAYIPVLEDGKEWTYLLFMGGKGGKPCPANVRTIKGDTIINGECYKVLLTGFPDEPKTRHLNSFQREEDGKIFKMIFGAKERRKQLVFDMTLGLGDTIMSSVVTKIDTIFVNNVLRKRIYLTNKKRPVEPETIFVEGIGESNNSYYDPAYICPKDTDCIVIPQLVSYTTDIKDETGNVIFTQNDFYAPSYSAGVTTVKKDECSITLKDGYIEAKGVGQIIFDCYDITGKKVFETSGNDYISVSTSGIVKGLYVVGLRDSLGNSRKIKVLIR